MKKHLVVALAYDRLCTFEFGCTVELFALERPELGVHWYDFAVCAVEEGPIRAAGGITVQAPYTPELLAVADTIIIPGWRDATKPPPHCWNGYAPPTRVARVCARSVPACSCWRRPVCWTASAPPPTGAMPSVWRGVIRRLKCSLTICMWITARVITAAGSAAGLDMLLHLVRRDHGAKVGNMVAQRLVVAPHREGGQAQFLPRPMAQGEQGRLSKLMDWLRSHPEPHGGQHGRARGHEPAPCSASSSRPPASGRSSG
jgi:AraC family transcriptional activator FtrA